ncbi:MAG: hypothetical protein ACYS8X_00055 [Planctomycetota bacterium]
MRRRQQDFGSNLFAFQDVMAGLIGVVFFIVILMSLNIVSQAVSASEPVPSPDALAELAAKLEQLQQQHDELLQQVADRTDDLNAATDVADAQVETDIHELNDRLAALLEAIAEIEDRREQLALAIDAARRRLASAEQRRGELIEQRDALRAKAAELRPNVTYIIDDDALGKKPWLVEVTDTTIRVSARDGVSFLTTFSAETPEERLRQFMAWTKSLNRSENYFVVLIKPSGLEQAESLTRQLKLAGWQTGKDLLPESWQPFGRR